MKTILSLICLFLSVQLFSQTISKKDSLEISSKIEDWNRGWKVKDHVIATKWYADDVEFTNAFGHNCRSQKDVEKLLGEVFKLNFVMSGDSKVTEQRFKQITSEAILVITQIERIGQKDPEGRDLGVRKTSHHRLFKKTSGEWKIISHLISDARDTKTGKQ